MEDEIDDTPSSLADYVKKVRHNVGAPYPDFILQTDALLVECLGHLAEPTYFTSAQLFQIGFGSWRSAIFVTQAGAVAQVPTLLRHSLECALYAYLCGKDSVFEKEWFERETNPLAKKKMRSSQQNPLSMAKRYLKKENPNLEMRINEIYQILIDFGAHPNVFMLIDIWEEQETDELFRSKISLLADEDARHGSFIHAARVGIDLLRLFSLVWPIRFGAEQETKLHEITMRARLFTEVRDVVARQK